MSISNVTFNPNPPRPGQPVTVTFDTPQSMVPVPEARWKIGRESEQPVPVRRLKSGKWECTVTASANGTGILSIAQGTMFTMVNL